MNSPRWPDLGAALTPLVQSTPDLVVRQLAEGEVDRLIGCLHRWYPALAVAEVRYMLSPEFYRSQVAFAGQAPTLAERPYVMVVVERAGELESCVLLGAEEDGRVLAGTMTVVSPAAYGRGLGGIAARTLTAVARAIGADVAYALAELDNHASRRALEAAGLMLCAVVPGSERKSSASGAVVWVAEAMYALSLAPESARALPHAATLTPSVAALVRDLWGVEPRTTGAPGHAAIGTRATGVDAGCRLVPLRDLAAQRAAEAAGLVVLGLVPGSDRHIVDGVLAFGFDALYGRPADRTGAGGWPAQASLPPRLAALVTRVRVASEPVVARSSDIAAA